MRWLLGNWELKLVSLVVAVALWTYTSGQVRVERQILVELTPAQISGLPASLQVSAVEPAEFVAVLSVPTSKLGDLRDQALRPLIELPRDRREAGDVELALTGRLLGLDSDIRVLRTEPGEVRSVTIRLSAQAFATLPAEAPPVVGLPAGIAATVRLDRTRVEVRGPGELIAAAMAANAPLTFTPIHLDGIDPGLTAPHEERIVLRTGDGQFSPVEPVLALVTLRPARTATVTLRVPVSVLLEPGEAGRWRVEGGPPVAEVRLTGPDALVRSLRVEDLVAWIDLHQGVAEAGERELPVLVQPLDGVQAEAGRLRLRLVAVP
jgi:hypothetical protein